MVGGQLNGYGSHAFYSAAYPDQYDATRTLVFSGQWSVVSGVGRLRPMAACTATASSSSARAMWTVCRRGTRATTISP